MAGGFTVIADYFRARGANKRDFIAEVTDKKLHTLVHGTDIILGGNQPIPLDRDGRHANTIEVEHSRIHEGVAYIHSHEHIIDNDGTVDHLLKNPANVFPHLRWWRFIVTSAPGMVQIFKNPTITDEGTPANVLNLNENSTNTPDLAMFSTPTFSNDGTQIYIDYISGGKLEGGAPDKILSEILLKPSTNYLIRYTNRSGVTSDVNTNIFWYES